MLQVWSLETAPPPEEKAWEIAAAVYHVTRRAARRTSTRGGRASDASDGDGGRGQRGAGREPAARAMRAALDKFLELIDHKAKCVCAPCARCG